MAIRRRRRLTRRKKAPPDTSAILGEQPREESEPEYGTQVLEALKGGSDILHSMSHYQMKRELGEGGMGSVFLAEHVSEGDIRKPVAVKVIKDTHDPKAIENFVAEAKILAQLSQGTIVEILALESKDVDMPAGDEAEAHKSKLYFMVMEYIDGPSFEMVLRRHAQDRFLVHPAVVGFILNKAAIALAEAHTLEDDKGWPLNLVHRDISPSNILIAQKAGICKLADFGVAKAFGDFEGGEVDESKKIIGKPPYMSPEQLEGNASAASDIWGLGVIGYEALTGYRPYHPFGRTLHDKVDNLKRQFNYQLRAPAEVLNLEAFAGHYDIEILSEIIMKCLNIDPKARPTAAELNEYLETRFLYRGGVGPSNKTLAAYLRLTDRSAGEGEIIPLENFEQTEDYKILCATLHVSDPVEAFRVRKSGNYRRDFVKAVKAGDDNACLYPDDFGPYKISEGTDTNQIM